MNKNTKDFDNAFKTLKVRHTRLFIAVINEAFHKNYPLDSLVVLESSEGEIIDEKYSEDNPKINEKINDLILKIGNDRYLIECQSEDDGSMAIRLAEYTFIVARNEAERRGTYTQGQIVMDMPHYTIVYLRAKKNTPRNTEIIINFPNGECVNYSSENIFLNELSKEDIFDKGLYAFIPFYVMRYEIELSNGEITEKALEDLAYLEENMVKLRIEKKLSDKEEYDLRTICRLVAHHFTNGNEAEKEVDHIMGGEVLELPSDKLIRETTEKYEEIVADKDAVIADKDAVIAERDATIADQKAEIARLKAALAKKNNTI